MAYQPRTTARTATPEEVVRHEAAMTAYVDAHNHATRAGASPEQAEEIAALAYRRSYTRPPAGPVV